VLHEIYFDGLGGNGEAEGDLAAALARDFGSLTRWREEFVAMGKALAGGSGWVLLCWSPVLGRLINQWAADHAHCLAGGDILLALDMYEHAYHLDYGANAAGYVEAFMTNIAWNRVAQRYAAVTAALASMAGATPREIDGVPIVDVDAAQKMLADPAVAVIDARKDDDYAMVNTTLPGARHFAPERLDALASAVPTKGKALVYCAYGFEIGRAAAQRLRQNGVDAVVLRGGIAAWRADGLPTTPAPKEGAKS
jgi:Fe-Mn family superoxide dismutase